MNFGCRIWLLQGQGPRSRRPRSTILEQHRIFGWRAMRNSKRLFSLSPVLRAPTRRMASGSLPEQFQKIRFPNKGLIQPRLDVIVIAILHQLLSDVHTTMRDYGVSTYLLERKACVKLHCRYWSSLPDAFSVHNT